VDEEWYGLREWISEPFARQYDLVLTRAIQQKRRFAVEALFDGRRWIMPEFHDRCFIGARRQVDELLAPLRTSAESVKEASAGALAVEDHVKAVSDNKSHLLINLLPEAFHDQQNEAVDIVRNMAINVVNKHEHAELAYKLLYMTTLRSRYRDASLKDQISRDLKQLEELVAKEAESEAKLTLSGKKLEITRSGVRHGDLLIRAQNVASMRWGIVVSGYQDSPTYDFLMVTRGEDGTKAEFAWRSSDVEKQRKNFQQLVKAALVNVLPHLVTKAQKSLNQGEAITVGPCSITASGVQFNTAGWLSNKSHSLRWDELAASTSNGELVLQSKARPSVRISLSLRDVDNACLLDFFVRSKCTN
jgi:hypothetical protein